MTTTTEESQPTTTVEYPIGTVTFLFTDIEGSTTKWEQHPEAMQAALARHDAIMRNAVTEHRGVVFKTIGDAFCAAFPTAQSALASAIRAQHDLYVEQWSAELGRIRVRMAIHTGAPELRDGDYYGKPLNRVNRLLGVGHGGQILLTLPSAELVRESLPDTVRLIDLGEHRLKEIPLPEHILQVAVPFLPTDFPPLLTVASKVDDLPPYEEVIGITVGEQARAFPITTLRRLRVLNDDVGGTPVAVVFDPSNDGVSVFRRRYGPNTLKLALDPNDDRYLTNDQRTMWWNLRGEPVTSIKAMPTVRLEMVMCLFQRWATWRAAHPNTTVFED